MRPLVYLVSVAYNNGVLLWQKGPGWFCCTLLPFTLDRFISRAVAQVSCRGKQFFKIKEDNGMAKNTAGSPLAPLLWAGKKVHIGEVDSTLSTLWKMSADNMRIGANLNVRTSVLNLIICTSDTESARYASQL